MKKAIITGANGFVGAWLTKELTDRGAEVYAVIKDKNEDISNITRFDGVKIIYCELENIKNLHETIKDEVDCFYHLAWAGSGGALRADYTVQLSNTKCACDAAYAAKQIGCKKFLAAGTVTENIVDSTLGMENVSQNMMYGICKKTTHLLLNAYCTMIDLPFIWMQFSNIYGPGNFSGNLISYTLTELIGGRRPSFSKGSQPYDFVYIKDLVKAAYLLGEKEVKGKSYFLGSGSSRLLCEYLSDIPKILGNGYSVGIGERPEDGIEYKPEWFDISDLSDDTGFKADHSFEEGITETFRWVQKYYREKS